MPEEIKTLAERLYSLKLFEEMPVYGYLIIRVPGGWVMNYGNPECHNNTFIPFDNEFQEVK